VSIYAGRIREALAVSIDTTRLAEAWIALHAPQPAAVKAIPPALAAFLADARDAIIRALRAILPRAWTEGWVLGQIAANAVVQGLEQVDWQDWTPGDYEAAAQIAGPGLRQLLAQDGIIIRSIAETRLEELSAVLEETLASDIITRDLNGPVPVTLSVQSLASQLEAVLDNPNNAELVAQAEIGRAQAHAARELYAVNGVTEVEISTAHDAKVCPICLAAAAVGPHPVGTPPMVLLHPRCRCAELAVLRSAVT